MNVDFEHVFEIGNHSLVVNVEAEAHIYDYKYGEDADGNRGEWRVGCDDFEVIVFDSNYKNITDKLEKKYKDVFQKIEDVAYEKLFKAFKDQE